MMNRRFPIVAFIAALCYLWPAGLPLARSAEVGDALHDSALGELQRALKQEAQWVKVHAAEALLLKLRYLR
jgi:hypothetical protein